MKQLPEFAEKKLDRAYSLINSEELSAADEIYKSLKSKFPRHPWIICLGGVIQVAGGATQYGLDIICRAANEAKDESCKLN